MGTKTVKVKSVQPTEIKDKAMVEQIIKEVRRHPTKARLAKIEKDADNFMAAMVRK
jgi:hypothetical protein